MRIIVEDLAERCLDDMLYYNMQYSFENAIETEQDILQYFDDLEDSPYIGRYISEILDKHFRELVYRRNQNSYRIVYYISEKTQTIYILHISNFKQDFKRILKRYNYFKNYYDL